MSKKLIMLTALAVGLLASDAAQAFLAGQPGGKGAYTDQRSGGWSDGFKSGLNDLLNMGSGRALDRGRGGTGGGTSRGGGGAAMGGNGDSCGGNC